MDSTTTTATYLPIAQLADLVEDRPSHAEADGIDLVLVRRGSAAGLISVLVFPSVALTQVGPPADADPPARPPGADVGRPPDRRLQRRRARVRGWR